MRQSFSLLFISLSFSALASNVHLEEIKDTIADCQKKVLKATSDRQKSEIYYALALAYHKDQESDKAFKHFLESLKYAPILGSLEMDEKEASLHKEALEEYLTQAGSDPIRFAKSLLHKYGEIASQNRDYLHLNFLIATAYANLGEYDQFFARFYGGYPYLSDTFIAYKTQGILYLRLSQHGNCPEERYAFQKEAFRYLTRALERNPKDSSLYKVLIFLAKDEKNDSLALSYLQKMVEHKVHIPRGDIYLYVREAISFGEYALGQEIIDQARAIYDYSRAISDAQEYLNQHRG